MTRTSICRRKKRPCGSGWRDAGGCAGTRRVVPHRTRGDEWRVAWRSAGFITQRIPDRDAPGPARRMDVYGHWFESRPCTALVIRGAQGVPTFCPRRCRRQARAPGRSVWAGLRSRPNRGLTGQEMQAQLRSCSRTRRQRPAVNPARISDHRAARSGWQAGAAYTVDGLEPEPTRCA